MRADEERERERGMRRISHSEFDNPGSVYKDR